MGDWKFGSFFYGAGYSTSSGLGAGKLHTMGGTLRFAPYVEAYHASFLDTLQDYCDQTIDYSESSYKSFMALNSDEAFFGAGYVLSNFPSLHDMFGKFMVGLDIDSLFSNIFENSLAVPEIDALTETNISLTNDNIVKDLIPKFVLSMRSLNAVVSSSFIIGKTVLEERRVKLRATISANLKYLLIPDITERWIDSLNQKKKVIFSYAFIMKLQFMAKLDTDRYNYRLTLRHILWPFMILEYKRAALAALRGPKVKEVSLRERSDFSKGLLISSYWMMGISIGSYFGPIGAIIGGIIGYLVGLAIVLFE